MVVSVAEDRTRVLAERHNCPSEWPKIAWELWDERKVVMILEGRLLDCCPWKCWPRTIWELSDVTKAQLRHLGHWLLTVASDGLDAGGGRNAQGQPRRSRTALTPRTPWNWRTEERCW